ncbi:MAG: DNA gyrase inhibitor YacG [Alphaproteobacteria bacterium]
MQRSCPICKRVANIKLSPFCSKRCQQIDLGRWLGEHYVIGGDLVQDNDGDATSSPQMVLDINEKLF